MEQILQGFFVRRALPRVPVTLLLLLAVLLMGAALRPGFSLSVGGEALPGVYRVGDVLLAERTVQAAATELLGSAADTEGAWQVHLRLFSTRPYDSDLAWLQQRMLEQVPGVVKLWAVEVDGTYVGRVADISALTETLEVLLAEQHIPYTLHLRFREQLHLRPCYGTAEDGGDLMAVSAALRRCLTVEAVSLDRPESLRL